MAHWSPLIIRIGVMVIGAVAFLFVLLLLWRLIFHRATIASVPKALVSLLGYVAVVVLCAYLAVVLGRPVDG